MKKSALLILVLVLLGLCFRIFCGIFVVQPIGAVPDGRTIIYWRNGLNLPFISSADGLLEDSGAGVSLLGRAVMLRKVIDTLEGREICRIGYYKPLYLWSTGGKEYDR